MKVTLTLHDLSSEHADKILDAAAEIAGNVKEGGGVTAKPGKGKKNKPKPEETEDDDMGLGEDEESEDETEETDESEETEDDTDEAEEIDVDQVKAAFSKYCKTFGDVKKGRAAARKVLAKFKVQSVDDLKEKDYAKVLEMLKKK